MGKKKMFMRSFGANIVNNTFIGNIVSYYQFENNVLDSVGANDGVATAITYAAGQVGNAIVSNGISSDITIPDSNDLSFTDGVNDLPFSISGNFKFTSINSAEGVWLVNKRDNVATKNEWQFLWFSNTLRIVIMNQNNGAENLSYNFNWTPISGVFYNLVCSYNGNKNSPIFKLYIDGIEVIGTLVDSGLYTGMSNTSSVVDIANRGWAKAGNTITTVDELAIFNKELTQVEVTEIYNLHNSGNPLI